MKSIYVADDDYLYGRLHEIDDDLSDYFISGYKSSILNEERNLIKSELIKRGYDVK